MKSKIIMGSAISLAAIAVAIDHTKHKLPEPAQVQQDVIIIEDDDSGSPCSLGVDEYYNGGGSPCGL